MQKKILILSIMFVCIHSKALKGYVEDTYTIENIGNEINDEDIFKKISNYFFRYDMPSIVSYLNDDAECYYIGDRCIFELDNKHIFMEIDFDEDKPEYSLVVLQNDKIRQLKAEKCEDFNKDIRILSKSIECEITEYAHVIKIKNI